MKTASVGFHCPECTKAGKQQVYTRATMSALNRPIVTQALIAVNAAVFVAGLIYESSDALAGRGGFIVDGGLFGPAVDDGEWWRIVTSGFLHGGLIHIGFNMYLLYQLGSILEQLLGRARFAAVYFTSLLCGSFGVLLLQPDALTVGASGAVFGLMGVLFLAYREKGIDPFSTGIASTIGINLLLTFTIPGISIGGHVGGLLGGLASAWLLFDGGRTLGTTKAVGAVISLGAAAFAAGLLIA